jgi:hypothetical protein
MRQSVNPGRRSLVYTREGETAATFHLIATMKNRAVVRLNFVKRAMLVYAMAVVAGPLAIGLLRGQSSPSPSFEVASIKINTTQGPGMQHWGPQSNLGAPPCNHRRGIPDAIYSDHSSFGCE